MLKLEIFTADTYWNSLGDHFLFVDVMALEWGDIQNTVSEYHDYK